MKSAPLSVDNGRMSVDNARMSVDNSRMSVDNARMSAGIGPVSVDYGRMSVDNRRLSVDNSRMSVDSARMSAAITGMSAAPGPWSSALEGLQGLLLHSHEEVGMAKRFPRSESDIATLAARVIEGLTNAAEDFPTPPVPADQLQPGAAPGGWGRRRLGVALARNVGTRGARI